MRVSEIFMGDHSNTAQRVETRSDAITHIGNDFQLRSYIKEFGNVVVEFDESANLWRVPEFAPAIARYNAAKTLDCKRWGSE